MTPEQIAASGSESAQQKALFAWAAVAAYHGFSAAQYPASYVAPGWQWDSVPVPALRWLHSIPNGGARDKVTAARLKAEGVRSGVADVLLPVGVYEGSHVRHGLYIEMKAGKGKQSAEQIDFQRHCDRFGYKYVVCYDWVSASEAIKTYLSLQIA